MIGNAELRSAASAVRTDPFFAIAPWLALVTACAGGDGIERTTITDSAGVSIIASSAPAWGESDAWHTGQEPALRIGEPAQSPAEEFTRIRRVFGLPDGTIVVVNAGRPNEIRLFDGSGAHIRTIGREGAGPGELRAIWDAWIAGPDMIVVFDPGLSRFTSFGLDGSAQSMVTFEQRADRVAWLPWARFSDGTFLLRRNVFIENVDGGSGRSVSASARGSADGATVDTIGVFPESDYYTRSSGNPGFTRFGRRAILYVSGMRYFRGMGDSFAIDEYDVTGRHVRSIRRASEPQPVTQELLDRVRTAEIEAAAPRMRNVVETSWTDAQAAETLPAYGESWIMDAAGNLWIQHYATIIDPVAPWSVFDPDGRWLGVVAFPDAFTPHEIGADYVLGVYRNELDVESVRRYDLIKPD